MTISLQWQQIRSNELLWPKVMLSVCWVEVVKSLQEKVARPVQKTEKKLSERERRPSGGDTSEFCWRWHFGILTLPTLVWQYSHRPIQSLPNYQQKSHRTCTLSRIHTSSKKSNKALSISSYGIYPQEPSSGQWLRLLPNTGP